jgi:hypothetical protein
MRIGRALAGLVLATTVLMTACGGDDDDPTSGASATSAPTSGGASDQAFCDAVKAQAPQLASVNEALSEDAEVRRRFYERQKALNAKVAEAAPADLRSDAELHVRASDAVADAQISGDEAARAAAAAQLSSPEVLAAGTRLADYARGRCGLDATTTTTSPGG